MNYSFKKGFYPIVEWFRIPMRLLRKSHETTNPSIFYVHILHQAVFLLIEFEVVFLHSLHKGLEFRHLLPYCPKSWNMNFWRINASSWGRNLYEVALLFHVGVNRTGHMSYLTGQERTPKFARQVLPDWTKSGLIFLNILHLQITEFHWNSSNWNFFCLKK